MPKRRKSSKYKRFNIALSSRDAEKLSLYAHANGIGKALALRRIIKDGLSNYEATTPLIDKNQISLFDSLQIDIFNNTTLLTTKNTKDQTKS